MRLQTIHIHQPTCGGWGYWWPPYNGELIDGAFDDVAEDEELFVSQARAQGAIATYSGEVGAPLKKKNQPSKAAIAEIEKYEARKRAEKIKEERYWKIFRAREVLKPKPPAPPSPPPIPESGLVQKWEEWVRMRAPIAHDPAPLPRVTPAPDRPRVILYLWQGIAYYARMTGEVIRSETETRSSLYPVDLVVTDIRHSQP